ncbi:DUF4230 domain-containing protein [Flagellimonas eckloniae]|uniref:DUF4230 domain-containing protein n=1 Tax=Flagellimonas eckloniae TaxID=346185 RepID=A0A0Q1C1M7_9FLAO|nr:DUF4230 domain-containing protein [Allomuricauda eckloniae]KQC31127.1 hypothetical protein AAY42_15430 [Allomuricauda eckloniae]
MKKVLVGAIIALASVLIYKSCADDREQLSILKENSLLIQQELQNVSKLIVTEGHFVEVYNYADSKELFGTLVTADKKALVVVNAEATIAYDLSKVVYEMDEEQKTIYINAIPEAEIKINPDFEYYDVTADYFNPFKAEDYNTIKQDVTISLLKKVKASSLKSNAENRLISELSKIFVVTKTLGWTLHYEGNPIDDSKNLEEILP